MAKTRVSGAGKRFPTYCPLAVRFDAARLYRELMELHPKFESLATIEANVKNPSKWFRVADARTYDGVEHLAVDSRRPHGPRVLVPGKVPSWWGVSLTHVPDRPETRWGSSRFRRMFDGQWSWKQDLEIPYTRQLVGKLPFRRLDIVRVLSLPKGGIGPAHVDWHDDGPWEREGIASVSFLLRDGGVPMRFMALDGELHDVSDPVFYFKDCSPHGVPRTRARRLLLRVSGEAKSRGLSSLMKLESAIW